MKLIKLDAELILSYLKGQLAHETAVSVEEALLYNPDWLRVVEYHKENEKLVKVNLDALNQYFEKVIAKEANKADEEINHHSFDISDDELVVAYAKGELHKVQSFRLEERFLNEPSLYEKYELYLEALEANAFGKVLSVLDTTFEKELKTDNEQPVHRFLYPTLIRWASFAAAIALFIVATEVFYDSDITPTYYTLGEENTDGVGNQQQEILNVHSAFSNKLERLLRFGSLVTEAERKAFETEIQTLCTEDAMVVVENDGNKEEYSVTEFISLLNERTIKNCELIESEVEKESAFLFLKNVEGYKIDTNGEVLKRESASFKLSGMAESEFLITRFWIKC